MKRSHPSASIKPQEEILSASTPRKREEEYPQIALGNRAVGMPGKGGRKGSRWPPARSVSLFFPVGKNMWLEGPIADVVSGPPVLRSTRVQDTYTMRQGRTFLIGVPDCWALGSVRARAYAYL